MMPLLWCGSTSLARFAVLPVFKQPQSGMGGSERKWAEEWGAWMRPLWSRSMTDIAALHFKH